MGDCDVTESCTGSSASCPADAFAGAGTVCRPAFDLCDLAEACTGMDRFCPGDLRVTCNDGDPCTVDFCEPQTGMCQSTLTPDGETSRDGDGLCHTTDDNLSLYGTDGACGTLDDTTGDGVCDLLDRCDFAYDPGQEDSDRDGAGDACDATPCLARGLYAISGSALYRVDPATGGATFVASSFPGARDVAVDATETRLVVTSQSSNTLWVFDLTTGTIANSISLSGPWGVDLGSSSGHAYTAERDGGRIARFDLFGGIQPFGFGLSLPTGIDVNASETTAYVTESGTGEVSSVSLTGGPGGPVTLIAGGLSNPVALALDPSETFLYVIEQGANRLSRVSIGSGTVTTVTSSLISPQGIALDATGSVAYVTARSAPSFFPGISAVNLMSGTVTPVASCQPMSPCIPFNDGLALSPRPPVVLSLPDDAAGTPGSSVSVPVNLDDVTGLGVLSADVTVRFDPAVLSATSVGTGSLTGGCTVTGNLVVPGRAVLSVFCTSALTGGGSIASITFNVLGARGQGTPLDIVSALLNEGTPAVCADDGAFVVPVDIGGRVVYYRDHVTSTEPSTKPVDGAAVALSRYDDVGGMLVLTPAGSVSTDCAGDYLHAGLAPIRSYRVTPSKTDDFAGAIDPFDAALNAQHVVGLIALTPGQQLAADVSGNRALSSFDSARIAQFSVGLITQFAVAAQTGSDWVFLPAPQSEPNQSPVTPTLAGGREGYIEYLPVLESAENQDFRAILYGDVSGNWQGVCPPVGPGAPEAGRSTVDAETEAVAGDRRAPGGRPGAASLTLPDIKASRGEVIQVPVRAEGTGSAISFLLDLRFDPAVVRLVRVDPGAQASAFSLTANLAEPGRARLALFHTQPLGGDGDIAVATFEVVGRPGSRSALTLAGRTVNEGGIAVGVKQGSVLVLPSRTPR
jgi:sugar lactone lactonase YvrE